MVVVWLHLTIRPNAAATLGRISRVRVRGAIEKTMKPIHVAATIVRLFAICLMIYAVNAAIFAISLNAGNESPGLAILSLLLVFAIVIVACCLWLFPISISRKITGVSSNLDEKDFSFGGDEFATICFFTLGLYFLYGLIGEGIYWFKILNDPMFQKMQSELTLDQRASLWAFGFRAAFVFFLLIGNKYLLNIFNKLRLGG